MSLAATCLGRRSKDDLDRAVTTETTQSRRVRAHRPFVRLINPVSSEGSFGSRKILEEVDLDHGMSRDVQRLHADPVLLDRKL